MTEITLRYKVVGIGRCQICGHVEIQSLILGGTAADPTERPSQIEAPDPSKIIKPSTPQEQITHMIEESLRGVFPGMDPRNIQRTPGGAIITLSPRRHPGASHSPGRRPLHLALTDEEYKLIAPITIGDILVQKISREAKEAV